TVEFFRIKHDIPFMRHALIFNVISALTFILAVFFLWHKGLHLSVDFVGGTVMETRYAQAANLDNIRDALGQLVFADVSVQNFGTSQDVLIRLPLKKDVSSAQLSEQVLAALKTQDPSVQLQRVEFVGPQVGSELVEKGLLALLFVAIGIVIYLAIRFEWRF